MRELCHKCDRVTVWSQPRKNSKRVKCEGCGDVFPCAHKCKHIECLANGRDMEIDGIRIRHASA